MLRMICLFSLGIGLPSFVAADVEQGSAGGDLQTVQVPLANADTKPAGSGQGKKSRAAAQRLEITPEVEAAAIEFAERHHPELTNLLLHLKRELPKEYERAIRDLTRTSNRLQGIQRRDPQRHRMELRLWQTRSRAQLLSARLQINPTEKLRNRLRNMLKTEYDLRQRILQRERDRLGRRIQKLDKQLDELKQNRSQLIERQLSSLAKPRNRAGKAKQQSAKRLSTENGQ